MNKIINFAIIAHVDHGKSTLADRFLEITGTVKKGDHEEQLLDRNPISRERGITIKLAPVTMEYEGALLNLIDTPGHVDFSYEVERTLACVEGVILLVDATQGVQAQTIAHTYKALEQNLVIIPVVNKVDLIQAETAKTKKAIAEFLAINEDEVSEISAKTGQGVEELLKLVIQTVPAPKSTCLPAGRPSEVSEGLSEGLRALIFDSYYDKFRGVIGFIRIFNGEIKKNQKLKLIATNTTFEVQEVGIFTPELTPKENLLEGEIGYIVTNLKDIQLVTVGDTIASIVNNSSPLPGYKKVKPMVYASVFTTNPDDYVKLKKSLEKLRLNDSALTAENIYSRALGSGFRVGFLGLLHADVVRERLEREFDLSLILTLPTVKFEVETRGGKSNYKEPIAEVNIVTPQEYVGRVMQLAEDSRGKFITMDNKSQVILTYEIPLTELIVDFFDKLKTTTSGYASFDWRFKKFESADVDRLLILLNDEPIEEFSDFVVAQRAFERGRLIVDRLYKLIPKQQFEIKIAARFKGKIIASQKISPFRKNVTGGLYGGDRTRKDKLLDKQRQGKKLMKSVGRVEIPKEVFFKLLKK